MNQRFVNQAAIITGGADGLGKGIAYRIALEGGKVVLFDINKKLLDETVQEFQSKGLDAEGLKVDISNEDEIKLAFKKVAATFGEVHIMINSAGVVGPTNTKITDYSVEEFDKIYHINLRGAFLMTKYSIKAMEPNKYGRILLIASIAGKEGNPNMAGYSSMKAGVIGLVKGIGKEYAELGITVNGLAPAVIKTSMNGNTAPEQLHYMIEKIPKQIMTTPDRFPKRTDCVSVAFFLMYGR